MRDWEYKSKKLYAKWILLGAVSGAVFSGLRKIQCICREPCFEVHNELLDPAIRGVYQTSRVAFHAGIGAVVGATAAATAPVSIPLYHHYSEKRRNTHKECERTPALYR